MGRFSASLIARWRIYQLCGDACTVEGAAKTLDVGQGLRNVHLADADALGEAAASWYVLAYHQTGYGSARIAIMATRYAPDLLRRGLLLEYTTLGWNLVGIVVLALSAVVARSVALAGFGLDSLIEIGASMVVVWELTGTDERRRRRALRLIGGAFALLALYLLVLGSLVLVTGHRAGPSALGITWTTLTAAVMFSLAWGKARTGRIIDNVVLRTEARVTLIDGILATSVAIGLALNAALGWWWADPVAGFVLVYYAARECVSIFRQEMAT